MRPVNKNSKAAHALRAAYILLATLLLTASLIFKLYFAIGYALCALMFGVVQSWLILISRKDEALRQKNFKPAGFILLVSALGMMANGIRLLFIDDLSAPLNVLLGLMGVSIIMFAGLSAHIFMLRKDSSLAAKLLRFTNCAALSPPVSLIVLMALTLSSDESAMVIGCMSAILLGVISLLIALNMILISFCGYMTAREGIKAVSALIRKKKLIFMRAIIVKDVFLVVVKLLISLLSLSFFMLVNGLYSAGMGFGRFIAVRMHSRSKDDQLKDYRKIGGIILFSSICYVLYCVRLFSSEKIETFPMVIAIAIAFYTFVEFGINIRDIIRLRKSEALDAKALRALSFSSTLLCFVLTQTALMSFAHEGDTSFLNALSGIVFGSMAALVGLYVLLSKKQTTNK